MLRTGYTVNRTPGTAVDCGVGGHDGSTSTTFTCDVAGLAQTVATIQATDISVTS